MHQQQDESLWFVEDNRERAITALLENDYWENPLACMRVTSKRVVTGNEEGAYLMNC